jgi:hypothetical protein
MASGIVIVAETNLGEECHDLVAARCGSVANGIKEEVLHVKEDRLTSN